MVELKKWELVTLVTKQEREAAMAAVICRMGRCYSLAYLFLQDHPEWDLIHGVIRWEVAGQEVGGHAWAEREGQVWEPYMDATIPRETWYQGVVEES